VRIMGGARPAADLDLMCAPERGDVVRGRYGRLMLGTHDGELGDDGEGSVDRRRLAGFLGLSTSEESRCEGLWSRSVGRGEGLNSSIRSVSGTGSIVICFSDDPNFVTSSLEAWEVQDDEWDTAAPRGIVVCLVRTMVIGAATAALR